MVTDGEPSPKFQLHEAGEFVEVSVKSTVRGAVPDDADFVNDATGLPSVAVTLWAGLVLFPTVFVACSVTE